MSLHDRIKEARKNKGLTQEQLGEIIGVAKTTITGYEKNREPTAAKVGEIADALDVDVNFLFQDEVKELHENHATPEEFENIIRKYRFIAEHSPKGKETIDYILNREYEVAEMMKGTSATQPEQNASPVRLINYYYRLASAGTGQILFDMPPTERIEIPAIPEYRRVDYAIGVNGDSMKPTYNDGDLLLVEMTDVLEVGEIGIFSVDGDCYVKKLGEGELISLNEEYANIPLNETAKCMGRVIDKL